MALPSRQRGRAGEPSVAWVLFGLDGRIGREVFWLANILCALVTLPFVRSQLMLAVDGETGTVVVNSAFGAILLLVLLWAEVALIVKRLHDRGLTGWFCLFLAIPFVSIVGFIIVGLMPGTPGANPFGAAPNRRAT